ncbi:CBS domain-containing protein [Amycolatopsis sp. CA-230715]|uniref:CBS domain-containing protein n=1 Tax=Amycolatopsis sp. CA-230715 TaxID=2745196 RepID=UPI001C0306B4|nr:CBS domain-containing protein [Amycolatopsis sp. CA-230715]QWF85931.1 hypothetical protein HUW46_09412 [Amycolatopsis sp. CA-230715]
MRARDLMTAPVVTVGPGTAVKDAAKVLASHGFTALPVVDDDERLIGIVTEADLIKDRMPPDARHSDPEWHAAAGTVGAVMSTPAIAMGAGADVAQVCQALVDGGIRAMPIVAGSTVVGIVTRGDVVRVMAREDSAIAADVRHRLAIYGGNERWTVEVCDGVVRIIDAFDDATDRHVATLLAEAVPGCVSAEAVSVTAKGSVR